MRQTGFCCTTIVALLSVLSFAVSAQTDGVTRIVESAQSVAKDIEDGPRRLDALLRVAEAWAAAGDTTRALALVDDCRETAGAMPEGAAWEKKASAVRAHIVNDLSENVRRTALLRARVRRSLALAYTARRVADAQQAEAILDEASETISLLSQTTPEARFHARAALEYAHLGKKARAKTHLVAAEQALTTDPATDAQSTCEIIARAHASLGDVRAASAASERIASGPARTKSLLAAALELCKTDSKAGMRLLETTLATTSGTDPDMSVRLVCGVIREFNDDFPAAGGAFLTRSAEDSAVAADKETRPLLLRTVMEAYATLERWDDALRIARTIEDDVAVCRYRAHHAVALAKQGRASQAIALMADLDADFLLVLEADLLADLGSAYADSRPDATVADVKALPSENLRISALSALAFAAAREGNAARCADTAIAMGDSLRAAEMCVPVIESLMRATDGSLEDAVREARRIVAGMGSPFRRQQALFPVALRLVEKDMNDAAAEIVSEMHAILDDLSGFDLRAELLLNTSLILSRLGRTEDALNDARTALRLLPSVSCGSCVNGVTNDIIPHVVKTGEFGFFEQVAGLLATAREMDFVQGRLCDFAADKDAGSKAERERLLGIALKIAANRRYAPSRSSALLKVAQFYLDTDLTPSPHSLSLIGEASAVLPDTEDAAPEFTAKPSDERLVSRVVLFKVKNCQDCEKAHELLHKMRDEHPNLNMEITTYDLDDPGVMALLNALEEGMAVPKDKRGYAPAVFTATRALAYDEITEESLGHAIVPSKGLKSPLEYLPDAGELPEPSAETFLPATRGARSGQPGYAYLTFFRKKNCGACEKAWERIQEALASLPEINVDVRDLYVDDPDMGTFCLAMTTAVGRGTSSAPTLVSANEALLADEITSESVARLIRAAEGKSGPETALHIDVEAAEEEYARTFDKLTIPVVIVAALADGVFNPCAFTVIIFFIAYLTHIGKNRREIFAAGITFLVAVFVTYIAFGVGLASILMGVQSDLQHVRDIILVGTGALLAVAAIMSFRDALAAHRGQEKTMFLRLPDRFQTLIRQRITSRARMGLTIGATLMLGALVAAVELPCTGLVYIPVILAITWGIEHGKHGAYSYLLIYNLVFIAPLVLIFAAAYFGVTSEQIAAAFRKRLVASKIVVGVVLLLLAAVMIVMPLLVQ